MKKPCLHYWNYVHTVYGGLRGGTMIRRWCHQCGARQVGQVTKWRDERPSEFDESPGRAAKAAERE